MTRELEIAWAAGLFEGEGCFHISRPTGDRAGRSPVPNAYLAMADFDAVRRFRSIVGVGTLTERTFDGKRAHWKTQLMWRTAGEGASTVANLLLPFLCERRHAAAHEIIQTFSERTRSCPACGRDYVASRSDQTVCTPACYDKLRRSPGEGQIPLLYERGKDLLPYEHFYRTGSA